MKIAEQLTALAAQFDALLPFGRSVELHIRRYADPQEVQLAIHGVKSYAEAQEIFRVLGIGDRAKSIWNDPEPRTVLDGQLAPGISLKVFCSGLPPSCRVEKYVERVPKTQVRVIEEGEFMEVEKMRVVCGGQAA
jgi:hypothetical protein